MGDLCNINMKEWYKLDIPHLVPIKIIATRSNKAYLDLDSDLKMRIFKNLQAYS
jgi:hypothetical protein